MRKPKANAMKSVSSTVHELLSQQEKGYRFSLADLYKVTGARSYSAVSAFITKMQRLEAITPVERINRNKKGVGRSYNIYELTDPSALKSRVLWSPRSAERGPAKAVSKRNITSEELQEAMPEKIESRELIPVHATEHMSDLDKIRLCMNGAIDMMADAERLLRKLHGVKTLESASTSDLIEELQKRVK